MRRRKRKGGGLADLLLTLYKNPAIQHLVTLLAMLAAIIVVGEINRMHATGLYNQIAAGQHHLGKSLGVEQ